MGHPHVHEPVLFAACRRRRRAGQRRGGGGRRDGPRGVRAVRPTSSATSVRTKGAQLAAAVRRRRARGGSARAVLDRVRVLERHGQDVARRRVSARSRRNQASMATRSAAGARRRRPGRADVGTSSIRTTTRSAGGARGAARDALAVGAPSFAPSTEPRALDRRAGCTSTVSDVTKRKSALTGARAAAARPPRRRRRHLVELLLEPPAWDRVPAGAPRPVDEVRRRHLAVADEVDRQAGVGGARTTAPCSRTCRADARDVAPW